MYSTSKYDADPPKKSSEIDLVDNLLSLIEKTTEVPSERPFVLNRRIEIDLDEIEEPFQNIPSSPLLIRNENSFSYSSVLIYMKKKFNLHAVSKLDHSVCGVKRTLENNVKENSENYSSPDATDLSTYKKIKKNLISATKEMDEENIQIDLSPPLKVSMHKARTLEIRKNLTFEDEKRRLSGDLVKKNQEKPGTLSDTIGLLTDITNKENTCSPEGRTSIKLKMNEGINVGEIEAES